MGKTYRRNVVGFDNAALYHSLMSAGKIPFHKSISPYAYDVETRKMVDCTLDFERVKYDKDIIQAPFIDEMEDFLYDMFDVNIFVTPRFDGWDNAQIGCHYSIHVEGESGGKDYSCGDRGCGSYVSHDKARDYAIADIFECIIKDKIKRSRSNRHEMEIQQESDTQDSGND